MVHHQCGPKLCIVWQSESYPQACLNRLSCLFNTREVHVASRQRSKTHCYLLGRVDKKSQQKKRKPPASLSNFFKNRGKKPLERISKETGELSLANDWVILDDVGDNRLIVPLEVCHVSSSLRPDIFIYSFFAKRALILELTCSNEDRFETSHVLKEKKYLKLRDSIIANGFDCNIFTIEVGVRGNICMDQLNIWTRHIGSPLAPTKALFCECTRIVRQCSYVLFQTRNLPTWHSRPLMRSIKEEPATSSFIKDGKEIFPGRCQNSQSNKTELEIPVHTRFARAKLFIFCFSELNQNDYHG